MRGSNEEAAALCSGRRRYGWNAVWSAADAVDPAPALDLLRGDIEAELLLEAP